MTTRSKIILAIAVVTVTVSLSVLVGIGVMSAEPLVGLLGVVTGALISEFSHQQSAREQRRHQLRLAALDRRLQAHQEAFSLWRRILKDMSDPAKIGPTVDECQSWWDNNCLYLTPAARQAFAQAYLTAHTRHVTVSTRDARLIREEFETIKRAGDLIVQGVEIPTISEGEERTLQAEAEDDA